ncbi:MAG: 50S ribosomal protein L24 [Methylovulum sp.]|jgi:large subunit ribosomal protein L24|nr:50S ribosomal protein L24 [Methylovulum sp.]
MKKIKKGDDIVVITGKDKGKSGRVLQVLKDDKLIIDGINQVKKSQKPNPNTGTSGGFVDKFMPIHVSNVALYNPDIKKHDKVFIKVLDNGNKVRVFKSTDRHVD